jgi:hypothetical protein
VKLADGSGTAGKTVSLISGLAEQALVSNTTIKTNALAAVPD